jgi:type IV pilus assembly protein PilC
MPNFTYVAINGAGDTVKGKIVAVNELDLEERLKGLGLDLIRYRMSKSSRMSFFGKVKPKDLIVLCIHLEQLERAGVPLLDAIADLRDTTDSNRLRDLLSDVYEQVKSGVLLSQAMAKYPKVFDTVFVGLVKAGEETGQLAESFFHLGNHIKWNEELKRKIKKAIRYPIALLILMMGVITVMMLFVVPQISEFLLSQGFELPIYTRALIATSEAFSNYWYIILGMPVFLFIIMSAAYRTSNNFAYTMDKILIKTPFLGQVAIKSNLARFTHFFTVTFISGIDILDCLDIAKEVVGNRVIKEAITDVRQNVAEGNSLTLSLTATTRFPNLVLRMFKVGEESGNMEQALKNVNYFYDREVNDSVESIVGVIQPALTIMMGMLLLWITAAVFGPLYDSFSKMEF